MLKDPIGDVIKVWVGSCLLTNGKLEMTSGSKNIGSSSRKMFRCFLCSIVRIL